MQNVMEETISGAIVRSYFKKLEANLAVDVAIVGAGPSGLVAARDLALAGLKVAMFESKLAPGGGTWGGGMLMNEVVVQNDAAEILHEFGIRTVPVDAEYQTLEMLRRENPEWGQGGSILVRSGDGDAALQTRAEDKDFKTLVLRSFRSNRNFDSWLAGGSEIWCKCGAVEDFCATTEAELRLYTPSITDFLIVVRRKQKGEVLDFNAVLVSEWTGMLDNCAFMLVEDDGGTMTTWKCSAMVKYNSRSYGFEIEIPLRARDDIIWRGALTRTYIERNNGVTGHFGDVDLVLELI